MIEFILNNKIWSTAQVIGLGGLFMICLSYLQNSNKRIVGYQLIGTIFFFFHFLIQAPLNPSVYAGALLNGASAVRCVVFYMRPKKWASHIAWLYIFIFIFGLCGVSSCLLSMNFSDGPVPITTFIAIIISTIATIIGTVAIYIINPKKTRALGLVASSGWFCHNIIIWTIPGMITELITMTSIIIGMVKFDFKKNIQK